MYNEAQKVLGKGLSPFGRWFLSLITGLFGLVMILIAPEMEKPTAIYVFGTFCIAIFIMCITSGRIRNYLGRCIGAIVFLLSVFYLASEITDGNLLSQSASQNYAL